jgi:molecular chaperone DnaK (HSP70)
VFVPVIHKNSPIPIRKTEAFMTTNDGQEAVEVTIYQGEDPDALNNIKIGEFRIEGLQDVAAGNIITLTLNLDLNGILQVSAQEKATGLEKSITIKNALSRFESSALTTAQQRITSLFGHLESDPDAHQNNQSNAESSPPEIVAARDLIAKAESLFGQISDTDKADIVDLIETITHCIDHRDIQGLEEPVEQLTDIIYYLES